MYARFEDRVSYMTLAAGRLHIRCMVAAGLDKLHAMERDAQPMEANF
jgi:hypothetical protein